MRKRWRETTTIGIVAFLAPFLGCAAAAYWLLEWSADASWLAGIALSTTSVAVVYAVMLEFGLNKTDYGKTVLAACFVNDLATVLALGLMFSPFTYRTLIFVAASVAAFLVLPWVTPRFFRRFGNRPSELEAKFLLLCLFGLGALAAWADSEAVLPAYVMGMVLAGTVGKDHALVRRLRTLTFGLLTPFYFIRAGSFVSVPALIAAPLAFLLLLAAKMATKFVGVYPFARRFGSPRRESLYTTLLMSTGLTFGTITSLYGLSAHIIDRTQFSLLVAVVVLSAIVPTAIAQRFYQEPFFLFLGRHIGLPVALEGALKLKEISYIPTDAYSAGEMKHGPIALLEEGTPVVCVATDQKVIYDKVVSNIQATRARGAHVIAIATDGNEDIQHHADDVIYVPKTHPFLQATLAVVPLQLLAYKIARLRGLNVDQPRNLAKTVTVE
jgi:Kef-type K+ transport system membrane component KefB